MKNSIKKTIAILLGIVISCILLASSDCFRDTKEYMNLNLTRTQGDALLQEKIVASAQIQPAKSLLHTSFALHKCKCN